MLDNDYKKALRKMRLYNYTILDKPYTKNIEVSIDKLKISCNGIRLGGMLLNSPKGLENALNATAAMTIEHMQKAFEVPIFDEYLELAKIRMWHLQHTVEFKGIINNLFEFAMKGNVNQVEIELIKLKKYIVYMLDKHWVADNSCD